MEIKKLFDFIELENKSNSEYLKVVVVNYIPFLKFSDFEKYRQNKNINIFNLHFLNLKRKYK